MNRLFAEIMGTATLVFCGCGAMVVNDLYPGTLGHVGVCLVWGLVVMAMIYAVGNISGAHLNPAVTLGFTAAGRFPLRDVAPYIAAQLFGAILAAHALKGLFPSHETLGGTFSSVETWRACVLEGILTFILMFVILNVSTGHMEKGIMAGVAVGGVIALEALLGGPVTKASMNPARSIGPALASWNFEHLWLYIVGPVTGALLASPTCRWIQGKDCCVKEDGETTSCKI